MKNRVNLIKLSVYGLMVSLLLSIIFSVSVFTLENSANKLKHNEIVSKETLVLTAQNHILSHRIDDLAANLVFLRSTYIEFIIKDFPYNDLDDDWIVFANQMKCFDKIRFIDLIGNEILRIDYNESTGAYMVDSALLENKASAAYFQDAIKLDEGQIAVSSISLETSAGQVVVPNKPLLRLSTPVYAKGKLIGITVIDYLAKYILADYQSVSDVSVGNNFLLNTNGYWLYNDIDPLKSWSFTNPNKLNVNFPNEYPEVWKQIKSNKSGEIQTKSYCFIYQDMTPVNQQLVYSDVQSDNDSEWIALTMIPTKNDPFLIYRTEPISFMLHVSQTYLLVYGYIILLGFAIAFLLLIYLNDNKKIKYISERDIRIVEMHRFEGKTFTEIGDMFEGDENSHLYEDNVKTAYHRAIKKIDELLIPEA